MSARRALTRTAVARERGLKTVCIKQLHVVHIVTVLVVGRYAFCALATNCRIYIECMMGSINFYI